MSRRMVAPRTYLLHESNVTVAAGVSQKFVIPIVMPVPATQSITIRLTDKQPVIQPVITQQSVANAPEMNQQRASVQAR
jgi:hypothetical protein